MTNDPIWWSNMDNQAKAQQYAQAHQWATRSLDEDVVATETQTNKRNASHHGWAILAGTTRKVYFDLGGEFNLADGSLFDIVKDACNHGNSTIRLIAPAELGYPNGVPIDMAAGNTGTSSIVRVSKWAKLNIEISTLQGRRLHLTQQTVGFVNRSSPLLLLGQEACRLCGYRTIEEQDEARTKPRPASLANAKTMGLTATQFERQPMGLTCTPCTFRRRQRVRQLQQSDVRTRELQRLDMDVVQRRPHEAAGTQPEDVTSHLKHNDDRPHSPSTVLEVDYVDLPSLVTEPGATTTDEESDESIPELLTMPPAGSAEVRRAHMQTADDDDTSNTASSTTHEHASAAPPQLATPSSTSTNSIPAGPAPPRLLDPTTVQHYTGDLLASEATYIVHQTNCVTRRAAGLAALVFTRFPYANCYRNRVKQDWPGTIQVAGGPGERLVVNLHGQYAPGKPTPTGRDTVQRRITYFQAGLVSLGEHIQHTGKRVTSVTFPARVGCGLAGGDWDTYLRCIRNFARQVNASSGYTTWVHVCHLPGTDGAPTNTSSPNERVNRNRTWETPANSHADTNARTGNAQNSTSAESYASNRYTAPVDAIDLTGGDTNVVVDLTGKEIGGPCDGTTTPYPPIARPSRNRKRPRVHTERLHTQQVVRPRQQSDSTAVPPEQLPRLRQRIHITDRYGVCQSRADTTATAVDRATAGQHLRQIVQRHKSQ